MSECVNEKVSQFFQNSLFFKKNKEDFTNFLEISYNNNIEKKKQKAFLGRFFYKITERLPKPTNRNAFIMPKCFCLFALLHAFSEFT